MLLSMTIKNFRSVKDSQTVNLMAVKDRFYDKDKVMEPAFGIRVLKSVAIIGPNGAGKSSFVRALEAVRGILYAEKEGRNPLKAYLQKAGFAYSDGKDRPSEITLEILLRNGSLSDENDPTVICYYTVKATTEKIYEESLIYRVNGSKKLMFERKLSDDGLYTYRFGRNYRGEKRRITSRLDQSRSFLEASMLKGGETAKEVYAWFDNTLNILPLGYGKGAEEAVIRALKSDKDSSRLISTFLWALDVTDISSLRVVQNDKGEEAVAVSHSFINNGQSEAYSQLFMRESLSLRRLILLSVSFFEAFRTEKTIVADDFGQLLHPSVLTHLVDIFQKHDKLSQLIVVDCNPSLLEEGLLRKDSIYFAQKGSDGATEYYSLADFNKGSRRSNAYERYRQGVYGALPITSEFYFTEV